MLMPHPETLRRLVEEYEALTAQQALGAQGKLEQRLQDLAYTLCVSTGTREVRTALAAARRQLSAPTGATGGFPASQSQAAANRRIAQEEAPLAVP